MIKYKNKRARIEIIIYIFIMYIVSFCVFLNGDDFMYGAFSRSGIIRNILEYYHTGNGRFWINILNSGILFFDRYLYIILNPIIIFLFILLMSKNVQWMICQRGDAKKERQMLRWGMVFWACLDVMCLRETVFWITGMMNYLFPAVVFLLGFLWFQQAMVVRFSGVKTLLYWVICFLAGSSVEQFACMFVGIMTLMIGWYLVKKKQVLRQNWIAYIFALIGCMSLLLAPGNFIRIDKHAAITLSFIDNVWTLIYQNSFAEPAFPFLLMFSLSNAARFYIRSKETCRLSWRHAFIYAIPIVLLVVKSTPLGAKAWIIVGTLFLFVGQTVYIFASETEDRQRTEMFMLLFIGLASQGMLLISAIWGFRCMFPMYLVNMILISCLLYRTEQNLLLFIFSSGLIAAWHPAAALIFWCVCFACKRKRIFNTACYAAVYLGVILAFGTLLHGYAGNVQTYKENIQNTRQPEKGVIVIREVPNDIYSWYTVPFSEFHERYYREYYNIGDEIEIIYE